MLNNIKWLLSTLLAILFAFLYGSCSSRTTCFNARSILTYKTTPLAITPIITPTLTPTITPLVTNPVTCNQAFLQGGSVTLVPTITIKQVNPTANVSVRKFFDNFNRQSIVKEAAGPHLSSDPNWWVNSGGYLYVASGIAKTIQGDLPDNDERRIAYHESNPSETDDGYHPQNIFRLVTRSKWQHYTQQVYFRITKDILSNDSNRDASNGLLLFNRYQDGQNLYYTGIRVDGNVVIKKKINGSYYTMAIAKYYSGPNYDRNSNPSLLPKNVWIGLKSDVFTNPNGQVIIKLSVDSTNSGQWDQILSTVDDGKNYGGEAILDSGYAGIRTDFMDVEFRNYQMTEVII